MSSPTSSKLALVGAPLGTLSTNKLLLVIFAALTCLIILLGAHQTQAVIPELLGNFGASNPQDWIPGSSYFFGSTQSKTVVHPIPKLMADAQTKFKKMITGQSKTLAEAIKEYKRRYGRDPPKGFDEWFEFAKENGVKIMDEYDQLVRDLEPFWGMSGEELRRRAIQAGQLPSIDLVRLENGRAIAMKIQKGFNDSEVGARARGLVAMVQRFQHKLPDMDFPINAKAEGRVLVPWEHTQYPNMTLQDSSAGVDAMMGGKFIPDWQGDSNVWEAYRLTCPAASQARRLFTSLRPQLREGQVPKNFLEATSSSSSKDADFKFVPDVDDNFDFCEHPWARYQQGHFFSDWRTVHVLYPVFSPAKGKGFSDILIPSHYYYSATAMYTYGFDPITETTKEVDDNEQPWRKKTDKIFWRGATTGGGSSPPGHVASYQRHRFLRMSSDQSDANRTVVFADPPGTDSFTYAEVPIKQLNNDFMDTAFTKAVGCMHYNPGGCEGLRRNHRFADTVPMGEHWRHKYLIDFDGMGYSARFFAFLASDSAVLKSTVYREYFSDWIQPWLHYIPLSQSYKEIYNIHAYFTPPSDYMTAAANATESPTVRKANPRPLDGDAQLRRIARAGRQWKTKIGRRVDMETYVYRLCIEWARLWSDDREAMTYKG